MAKTLKLMIQVKDKSAKAFKNVQGRMTKLRGSINSMAASNLGGVFGGAAMVGFGASILKTAGDFEASMLRVKAVSQANGKEFKMLNDIARKMGATTKYSATEAADALGFLAMAGFDAEQATAALPGTLQLAAAANLDLARSADIASNVLTGYGLEIEQLGMANDVLVTAMTNTNVDLTMLGEAMKYVGPIASGLNVPFTETAAAIGLMGNAGIQGSMAGTALRGALTRLADPTKAEAKAMKSLGLQAVNAKGEMLPLVNIVQQLEANLDKGMTQAQLTAKMIAIFGDRAGPGMAALVSQGSKKLDDLNNKMLNSEGIAAKTAAEMDQGLNAALKKLGSAWDELALTLSDLGALTAATVALENISTSIRLLADWLQGGSIGKAAYDMWEDIVSAFTTGEQSSVDSVNDMIEGILHAMIPGLAQVQGLIDGTVEHIIGQFEWMYSVVVGNSIVPDMIEGVKQEFSAMPNNMITPTNKAVDGVLQKMAELDALERKTRLKGATKKDMKAEGVSSLRTIAAMSERALLDSMDATSKLSYNHKQEIEKFNLDAKIAMEQGLISQQEVDQLRLFLITEQNLKIAELRAQESLREQEEAQRKIEANRTYWQIILDDTQNMQGMMLQSARETSVGLAQSMTQGVADMVNGVSGGIPNMKKAMSGMIAAMVSNWGQMYVLKGVAKIADSIWPPNPLGLASGAKMIAGGTALKAFAGSIGGSSGGSSGGGGGGGGRGGQGGGNFANGQPTLAGRNQSAPNVGSGIAEIRIDTAGLSRKGVFTVLPDLVDELAEEFNKQVKRNVNMEFVGNS